MDIGKDLTKRQQEIFDFIKKYSAKYGYPPTVRDIGKAVGLGSPSTVHAHLANLEKIGLLRRDPTKPRAIELLDRAADAVKSVVGEPAGCRSSATSPPVSRSSPRRTSRTPCRSIHASAATRASTSWPSAVTRWSMQASSPATWWSYARRTRRPTATSWWRCWARTRRSSASSARADHVRLQPENDSMEPIRSREVQILGRVVGVLRKVA